MPQDSIPLLFEIFANDIFAFIEKTQICNPIYSRDNDFHNIIQNLKYDLDVLLKRTKVNSVKTKILATSLRYLQKKSRAGAALIF